MSRCPNNGMNSIIFLSCFNQDHRDGNPSLLFQIIFSWFADSCDETAGSESLVSFDTAEQSLVSASEVTEELRVTGDCPETLALALPAHTNNPRLSIPVITNSA